MHPDLLFDLHRLRVHEALHDAEIHRQRHRRPRPPSRLRRDLAASLMYLADRLAADPAVSLPRAVDGANPRAAR